MSNPSTSRPPPLVTLLFAADHRLQVAAIAYRNAVAPDTPGAVARQTERKAPLADLRRAALDFAVVAGAIAGLDAHVANLVPADVLARIQEP